MDDTYFVLARRVASTKHVIEFRDESILKSVETIVASEFTRYSEYPFHQLLPSFELG